jgi:hypothetical protein
MSLHFNIASFAFVIICSFLESRKDKISKKESEQILSEIKAKFQIPDGIDFKASAYEDIALIGQGQFGKVWRSS